MMHRGNFAGVCNFTHLRQATSKPYPTRVWMGMQYCIPQSTSANLPTWRGW
jgi:hypothetical protein